MNFDDFAKALHKAMEPHLPKPQIRGWSSVKIDRRFPSAPKDRRSERSHIFRQKYFNNSYIVKKIELLAVPYCKDRRNQ